MPRYAAAMLSRYKRACAAFFADAALLPILLAFALLMLRADADCRRRFTLLDYADAADAMSFFAMLIYQRRRFCCCYTQPPLRLLSRARCHAPHASMRVAAAFCRLLPARVAALRRQRCC